MARIRSETLKDLLKRVLGTRSEEIGCETCYEKLDQFAELELEGKDASEILPLLKKHLESCQSCNEEYKALLTALKEFESG
ncbi:MAG: hypothetical protein WD751_08805 [Anaerolineales bacterium]